MTVIPFPGCLSRMDSSSERERKSIDAVIGRLQRQLHKGEAARFVERPPSPCAGADRFCLGDLLDRSVFDERTSAEAISHGKSPFMSMAAGEGWAVRGGICPRRRLDADVRF